MRVKDLMTNQVQCCRPEESLQRAAQLMWDGDCGCLPVCSGDGANRLVGVITDRDVCMSALFQDKPLNDLQVSSAMARQVHTCRVSDSLAQAERIMREARVRRLPVLDAQDSLAGMISLADLAREAARERAQPHKEITEVEVGNTLASICVPISRALAA